ncbi:hypothetical protein QAD02_001276 [Eretmocerus hayati]|uniref:Uncharacterized protein n=1 Tax=Eretmocerus hayati TaxID=131215 RepID=A0ACC2NIF0_9HYME|nr:hypothetical protein QAD02_001276 [Eretmocerus hayati]
MKAHLTKKELKEHSDTAANMLLTLGMFTKIFDETHDFYNMIKLVDDDVAISVGALLAKLYTMVIGRNVHFNLVDPTELNNDFDDSNPPILEESIEQHSWTLSILQLITIYSCVPNCGINLTREYLRIWHSLQPIKKGDKLILFNLKSSVYNYIPKPTRQLASRTYYNCSCDCRACIEDWSMVDLRKGMEIVMRCDAADMVTKIHDELVRECNFFRTERKTNSRKYMNPDLKTMKKVKNLLIRAWTHCEMPSTIITRAVRIFTQSSGYFYCQSIHDWK